MHKKKVMSLAAIVLTLLMSPAAGLAEENTETLEKATFAIEGMTCGGCVGAVKVQLSRTPGVAEYDVSWEDAEAVVTYDPRETDPGTIAESITESGFKATVKKG